MVVRMLLASGLLLLPGCRLLLGFEDPQRLPDAAGDARPDSPSDAAICTKPGTACYIGGGSMSLVACSPQPVATCDDGLFRFCDCGVGAPAGGVMAFFAPGSMNQMHVVHATSMPIGSIELGISSTGTGFICVGAGLQCEIDDSSCENGTTAITRWVIPRGPGTYDIELYTAGGGGGPCQAMNVLTNMTVTL